DKIAQLQKQFTDEEKRKEASINAVKLIGAGVEERFNWQHMLQYLNMALPRPNGDKLVEVSRFNKRVRQTYFTDASKQAFALLEAKRFAKEPLSPEKE